RARPPCRAPRPSSPRGRRADADPAARRNSFGGRRVSGPDIASCQGESQHLAWYDGTGTFRRGAATPLPALPPEPHPSVNNPLRSTGALAAALVLAAPALARAQTAL